jgi:hypothetical protein
VVVDNTFASKQHLRSATSDRRRSKPTRVDPDPENLVTTGPQFKLTPASPALPQKWRSAGIRTHHKTSLKRISTDFILAKEFVHDINEMLDTIENWDREDAKEIMKSFEDDPANEGREITFITKHAMDDTKHWSVVIKNPNRSIFHPEEYEKSHCLPASQRPVRIDWGIHQNGGLPSTCRNGCDQSCPRGLTKEDKERILKRGRELQQMEKSAQDVRSEMKKSKFSWETELKNKQDSVVTRNKRHWLDTRETSARKDPESLTTENAGTLAGSAAFPPTPVRLPESAKSPASPTSIPACPKTEPPNVLLTAAEWEKLEPLEPLAPPPTPRLKHMKLPAAQWENLDPVRPSPTPQPRYMEFSEWNKLNPIKPPQIHRPSAEELSLIADKGERDKLLMPPPPPPQPEARAPLPLVQAKTHTTP